MYTAPLSIHSYWIVTESIALYRPSVNTSFDEIITFFDKSPNTATDLPQYLQKSS